MPPVQDYDEAAMDRQALARAEAELAAREASAPEPPLDPRDLDEPEDGQ